jgi:glutaredoxin 3
MDPEKRREMVERSGRNTFPQIFIDGLHVGGCDDLVALDREGRLDPLLQAA